jgi:hypothetical protein
MAALGVVVSLPVVAQARPTFRATGAENGLCKILITASWSGARVSSLDFTLSTNAASYDSLPIPLGGSTTVERSGWMQYTFTTTTADTSGFGVVQFLSSHGRVVGSAKTDPLDIACI